MTQYLLLHGFLGAPHAWDRVVQCLDAGDVVHCVCLGGHAEASAAVRQSVPLPIGRPPVSSGVFCSARHRDDLPIASSFEDEVDRIGAWARGGTAEKSHLVGYSLGGRIALGLLVRHPELWHAATIIGAHPGLETVEQRNERIEADERWAVQLETEGLPSFLAAWEALPLFATQRALPRDVQDEQRAWRAEHDPKGLAWAMRTLSLGRMPSWRTALRGIEVPVTVAAGETDEKFAALADWMADVLPRGTARRIPNSGHNAVLERPDAVGALLQEDQAS